MILHGQERPPPSPKAKVKRDLGPKRRARNMQRNLDVGKQKDVLSVDLAKIIKF